MAGKNVRGKTDRCDLIWKHSELEVKKTMWEFWVVRQESVCGG